MLRFLFDTDHLTLFDTGHPLVSQRHASQPAGEVGISAVTVQEALRGRLAALARHRSGPMQVQGYANLVGTIRIFFRFPIAAFDSAALINNLVLLIRNRRDFGQILSPSLDDWSR